MNDLLGLEFDTNFSHSTLEKPTFYEFEPITVDGITFTLINGTWHAYLSPERLNDALAHPDKRITPTEFVAAAIKAGKVPIANGANCVITVQSEKGFISDSQGYYLDPNELQTIIPLPAKECTAATVADMQPTLNLSNPDAWLLCGGSLLGVSLVLSLLIRQKILRNKARHDAHAAGSYTEINPDLGMEQPYEDPKLEAKRQERIAHEVRRREIMDHLGHMSEDALRDLGLNHDYTARDGDDWQAWARILKEKDDELARQEIVTTVIPGKFQEKWRRLFGGK